MAQRSQYAATMTSRWLVQLVALVARGAAAIAALGLSLPAAAGAAEPTAPLTAAQSTSAQSATGLPEVSLRVDPFNWVLEGRLGLEVEVALGHGLSLELVPILVTSDSPPTLNLEGREDNLYQASNGLGPISGTSLGVGWWLSGRPLRGYVLRGLLTNYSYTFHSTGSDGTRVDEVDHIERELVVFFGSYSRWGAFTLGGGIGLGVSLTRQRRCFDTSGTAPPSVARATNDCRDDEHLIALDPGVTRVANLNHGLAPALLLGRLSLGVTF